MKTYGGVDVWTYTFLTSALFGGELSDSRPGRITPGERVHCTHWIGGWVALSRCGRHGEWKTLHPTETRTTTPESSSPKQVAIPTELSRLPEVR
jgi:hypothetical protein